MPQTPTATAPRSTGFDRTPPELPPRAERRPGTHWLNWSAWPTRMRMIALVLAIDALAALVSCAVVVLNARSAVEVEMQAAMTNVELLVSDTIDLAQGDRPTASSRP